MSISGKVPWILLDFRFRDVFFPFHFTVNKITTYPIEKPSKTWGACQRFVGNRKVFNSDFADPKSLHKKLTANQKTGHTRPIYTGFSLRNGNMKWFHSTNKIRPWWPSTATVTCTSAGSASRSKAAAAAAAAALGGNPAAAAFLARSLGRLRKRRNLGSLQVLHLKGWSKGQFGGGFP